MVFPSVHPTTTLSDAARAQLAARALDWIGAGDGATDADFWEASAIRLCDEPGPLDGIEMLCELFDYEEMVCMAREYSAKPGGTVADVFDWENAMFHAWLMGQPWRGQLMAPNPTGAGCRFLLATLAGKPMETQLALWWAAPLPLAALVHNGADTLQAWLKLDATTPEQVEQVKLGVAPRLRAMGCQTLPPTGSAPLARCPGALRLDTGEIQRLVFLDPLPPADGRGRRGVR